MGRRCAVCGADENEISQTDRCLCRNCGASARFRLEAVIATKYLFNQTGTPLADIAEGSYTEISALGLSETPVLANQYARICAFTNAFFHREPCLDINQPEKSEFADRSFDCIFSSDIFEHTLPPRYQAIQGFRGLLNESGIGIISIPTTNSPETIEHYPDIDEVKIVDFTDKHVVVTREGDHFKLDSNPIFHGGPGSVLEMRVWSFTDFRDSLAECGLAVEFALNGRDINSPQESHEIREMACVPPSISTSSFFVVRRMG